MLSCVGTLALFVSAVTPISTVTAPVAEAAPQTRQLITPIGYKMVNGKQDRENPLSAPDLLVDPGYSETRPNFGDQENNEDVIGTDDRYEVKDATQYPYRWVGTLTFTLESGKRVSCTGSLIGPDSVVTSGHCLSDKFTDMTFSPGQMAIPNRSAPPMSPKCGWMRISVLSRILNAIGLWRSWISLWEIRLVGLA